MKTSYFGKANSKCYKHNDLNFISIARGNKWWNGKIYEPLQPTWDMINNKNYDEYKQMYTDEILSHLSAQKVYEELGEDAILLCHESYSSILDGKAFCHRHIVAQWLEDELGIVVPELENIKNK